MSTSPSNLDRLLPYEIGGSFEASASASNQSPRLVDLSEAEAEVLPQTEELFAIVNPTSNGGKAKASWEMAARRLQRHFPKLHCLQTRAPGDATRLTRRALEDGAKMVLAFGGDGTINEVLAGFVDQWGNNEFPDTVLGILAAGSGSDFQRLFGPQRLMDQVDAFARSSPRRVDYGVIQVKDAKGEAKYRAFMNIASAGISGEVVRRMGGQSSSGPFTGTQRYLKATVSSIVSHRGTPARVQVDDNEAQLVNLNLACVCNGQYFGSGMQISPNSAIDDGQLHVILAHNMTRLKLMATLAKVYGGKHLRTGGVTEQMGKRIKIDPVNAERKVALELDGETFGYLPAAFEVRPKGIWIQVSG